MTTHEERTIALLKAAQFPVEYLAPDFIAYHLSEGRTPEQIVAIATKPGGECWCKECGATNGHAEGCRQHRPWAV